MKMLRKNLLLTCLIATLSGFTGCSQSAAPTQTAKSEHAEHDDDHDHKSKKGSHNHDEWWCSEHGVPEAICGQCDTKLAAEFQKNGDWCKEHDRPDSQCFKCHPELQAKFAAQYEAKFGKKPPLPEG